MSSGKKAEIRPSRIQVPGAYRSGPSSHGYPAAPHQKLNPSLNLREPGLSSGTYQVKQPQKIGRVRLWIYRNPIKFQAVSISIGLLIFFSRPLYDIFIREHKTGSRPKRELSIRF